jgi:integrase
VSERFNFTKKDLGNIDPPAKGQRCCYDSSGKAAGLCIIVTPAGARTFYWYGRADGRPERVKLGRFDKGMTVEQARKAARDVQARVDKGENPQGDKRLKRSDLTLGNVFERFKDAPSARTKKAKSPKTIRCYQQQWDNNLSRWTSRKLSTIKRADVERLHQSIGKTAPYQANRVLALLSALYRYAVQLGYTGHDPTRGVQKYPEHSRVRHLTPQEARRFLDAVEEEPSRTLRDLLLVLLYSGARRSNVQAMRWRDVDLKNGRWHIPETKTGEALTIPLPPPALAILKRRHRDQARKKWVFPSNRNSTGHIVECTNALRRVLQRANISDFRVHDLRHTLASWMVNSGSGLEVIGKQLGHRSIQTTAKYAHVNIEPTRNAVNTATEALTNAGKSTKGQGNG